MNDELQIMNIEIIDITGKVIQNSRPSVHNPQITINKEGIYFIKIKTRNNTITEKLIIH